MASEQPFRVPGGFRVAAERLFRTPSGLEVAPESLFRALSGFGVASARLEVLMYAEASVFAVFS